MCLTNFSVYTVCAHGVKQKPEKCPPSPKKLFKPCSKVKSVDLVFGWCPDCQKAITEANSSPGEKYLSLNFRCKDFLRYYWTYKATMMENYSGFKNDKHPVVPPPKPFRRAPNPEGKVYEVIALKDTIKKIDPDLIGLQHDNGLQLVRGEDADAIVEDAIRYTRGWVQDMSKYRNTRVD